MTKINSAEIIIDNPILESKVSMNSYRDIKYLQSFGYSFTDEDIEEYNKLISENRFDEAFQIIISYLKDNYSGEGVTVNISYCVNI